MFIIPKKIGFDMIARLKCRRYGMFVRLGMLGCGIVAKSMAFGFDGPMQVYCGPRNSLLQACILDFQSYKNVGWG